MDFLWDHAVAASAILLGVLVLAGLAVAGLSGLLAWRRLKAARARVTTLTDALEAESRRLTEAQRRMPVRQAELQRELAGLQARVAALGVLGKAAGEAAVVLRRPLRYLSG